MTLDGVKVMVVTATLLALTAAPAQAQMMGGGGRGKNTSDLKGPEQKKPIVDERAYKSALERIPEPKEKYDPWGVARPQPGKPQ
jgi:hypothetical protein